MSRGAPMAKLLSAIVRANRLWLHCFSSRIQFCSLYAGRGNRAGCEFLQRSVFYRCAQPGAGGHGCTPRAHLDRLAQLLRRRSVPSTQDCVQKQQKFEVAASCSRTLFIAALLLVVLDR